MLPRAIPALAAFLFLFSSALWGQQPAVPPPPPPEPEQLPPGTPSIRRNVNLVDVLVTVLDRNDRIVADLSQEDFRIFDDGVEQQIRFFSRETDLPLRVGLLLDTSNSIRNRLEFEQEAAINFLYNVLRRGKDEAFLMTVDDDAELVQEFTGNVEHLRDAILRQRAGGGTALYDAIYRAAEIVLAHPATAASALDVRRVLVVISDGEDNLSLRSRGEALEMAQRAGIVIYTISSSVDWVRSEWDRTSRADCKYLKEAGDRVLEQFAADSGGRAFFPCNSEHLARAFRDIGDELRSQYSLAYVPAGRTADGRFHSIRVEVGRRGLRVHTRKGYYAVEPEPLSSSLGEGSN